MVFTASKKNYFSFDNFYHCYFQSFVEKVDEQLTMKKVNPLSCSFKTSPHDQLKKVLTLPLDPCASENFKRRGGSFTKLRKCLKKTKSHEFKASIRVEKPSCSSDDMNLPKDDFMKEISVSLVVTFQISRITKN